MNGFGPKKTSFSRILRIERLEDRSMLSATATMLGEEFNLPSWLSQDQIPVVQQLASQITTATTNAPMYPARAESYPLIGVDAYYENSSYSRFDGTGYSIAILDSGADLDHPIFGPATNGIADRIVYQYDFAENDADASDTHNSYFAYGHGTHVAGIVAGAAPGASLIILKVFGDDGTGDFNDVQAALQWVFANASTYNIAAVNMSIVDGKNYNTQVNPYGFADEMVAISSMNIGISVAAGNSYAQFHDVQQQPAPPSVSGPGVSYPAADASAISVGATWDTTFVAQVPFYPGGVDVGGAKEYRVAPDRIAGFSQRHEDLVHIFAPGAFINSSGLSGIYYDAHGTSMAAPHVAAAIAIAQQMNVYATGSRLNREDLIELFQETGVAIYDGDDEDNNVTPTNAWYSRLDVFAMANRLLPPSVLNVILKETDGTPTEYHFNTVDGDGGQLMTVPVGDPTILQIQFSEAVTVAKSDLRLVGVLRGHAPDVAAATFTAPDATNDFTATWEFATPLVPANRKGDYYLLSLADTIVDADNNALDGEWTNPARMFVPTTTTIFTDAAISTFPSGNGTAGGDFNFLFTLYPGDADQNLVVNNTDFGAVINHFFDTGTWIEGDFNGDGVINNSDFGDVINNFFETLIVSIDFLTDLNNDGRVDALDEELWDDYEANQNLAGDFNGDLEVDALDLVLLQNQFGLEFALAG